MTHLQPCLPGNYNARSQTPDSADNACGARGCIRFDRRSGFYLSGGRGRPPWCVLVHHPISVKGDTRGNGQNLLRQHFERRFHLVIKSASAFEVIHVSGVRLSSPELHIRNLHITPVWLISAPCECLSRQNHPQWQPLNFEPPSFEMNSMELFGATYCGCSSMNSAVTETGSGFRSDWQQAGALRTFHRGPQTWNRFHPFVHGYIEALGTTGSVKKYLVRGEQFTIDFVIIMQVRKRVKIHIAMERHIRPADALDVTIYRGDLKPYSTRQYHR